MGKALRNRRARMAETTGPRTHKFHDCELPPRVATSIIRCDGCGHYWRYEEGRKRYLRLNRRDRREIQHGVRSRTTRKPGARAS